MFKTIEELTDDKDLIANYKQLEKIIYNLFEAKIFLFMDEDLDNPECKFLTAEIQKPFPDGIIFISSSSELDEIIRSIEDYIYFE